MRRAHLWKICLAIPVVAALTLAPVGSQDAVSNYERAILMMEGGSEIAAADELLAKVEKDPALLEFQRADALFRRGVCALRLGNREAAWQFFNRLRSEYPTHVDLIERSALVMPELAGRGDLWRVRINMEPDQIEGLRSEMTAVLKESGTGGRLILVEGNTDGPRVALGGFLTEEQARTAARQLAEKMGILIDPTKAEQYSQGSSPESLAREGWLLWTRGKHRDAESLFRESTRRDPWNANGWNGLGWALLNQQNFDAAREAFEKARSLDPSMAGVLNGLAIIADKSGQTKEAESLWREALDRNPSATAPMVGLADVERRRGNREAAVEFYERALTTEPQNEFVIEKLREVRVEMQRTPAGPGRPVAAPKPPTAPRAPRPQPEEARLAVAEARREAEAARATRERVHERYAKLEEAAASIEAAMAEEKWRIPAGAFGAGRVEEIEADTSATLPAELIAAEAAALAAIRSGDTYRNKKTHGTALARWIERARPGHEQLAAVSATLAPLSVDGAPDLETLGWRRAHLLGLLEWQLGNQEGALAALDRAIALYPAVDPQPARKTSFFQHLLNERARMTLETKGAEIASDWYITSVIRDSRCSALHLTDWKGALERNLGGAAGLGRYRQFLKQLTTALAEGTPTGPADKARLATLRQQVAGEQ